MHARLLLLLSSLTLLHCDQFSQVGLVERWAPRNDAGGAAGPDGMDDGALDAGAKAAPSPPLLHSECGPDNPAGLSASQVAQLRAGGEQAGGERLLYPYDGTVFPASLQPPVVMWEGPAAEAVLLRLRTDSFEYEGCLAPQAPGQVAIPEPAWIGLKASARPPAEAVRLELTTFDGTGAHGPIAHRLTVATAPLPLAVYYMGYSATVQPSVYRLRLGRDAELISSPLSCTGCHSVSSYGSKVIAFSNGAVSTLCADPSTNPVVPGILEQLPSGELAALTSDGALYVGSARPAAAGPRSFAISLAETGLVDSTTGLVVPEHNIPPGAIAPAFSADGTSLVFNDYALSDGHGLAIMDFDYPTRSASNYRQVLIDRDRYPAWPSLIRNTEQLVFALGITADFSANGAHVNYLGAAGPPSDLYTMAVGDETPALLARLAGLPDPSAADRDTYLPFGQSELHQNYYPQVAPIAASGYAWVFFDSIRHYGNQGMQRRIWGAALDLSGAPGDISHPPFYLTGQSVTTLSNLRATPALDNTIYGVEGCTIEGN